MDDMYSLPNKEIICCCNAIVMGVTTDQWMKAKKLTIVTIAGRLVTKVKLVHPSADPDLRAHIAVARGRYWSGLLSTTLERSD
jgi:hypothetical protein